MQELINKISRVMRAERSLTQMTLGGLIRELEKYPKDKRILKAVGPHSYRGYYSDLALKLEDGDQSVDELIVLLDNCIGETFVGYKGGDFIMDEFTPLWIAEYGRTGVKIMGIKEGDILSFDVQDDY